MTVCIKVGPNDDDGKDIFERLLEHVLVQTINGVGILLKL